MKKKIIITYFITIASVMLIAALCAVDVLNTSISVSIIFFIIYWFYLHVINLKEKSLHLNKYQKKPVVNKQKSPKSNQLIPGDWLMLKPSWRDIKYPFRFAQVETVYSIKFAMSVDPITGNAWQPIPIDQLLLELLGFESLEPVSFSTETLFQEYIFKGQHYFSFKIYRDKTFGKFYTHVGSSIVQVEFLHMLIRLISIVDPDYALKNQRISETLKTWQSQKEQ